jgi:glycosyltransferase involved in cell wall biosynthesis
LQFFNFCAPSQKPSPPQGLPMKILLLTQVVPFPADSGPKVKTYNVLRYLAQRHDVHLVSFVRSAAEAAAAEALRPLCAGLTVVPLRRSRLRDAGYLARSLLNGRPFLVERDDSAAMRAAIADLLRRRSFDAVHADQFSMAQFAASLPVPRLVLDEHNAVWTIVRRAARSLWGPQRVLAELEWRKVRRFEGQMCRRFDRVTVVSDDDRAFLQQAAGGPIPATVIPIAVDTTALAFAPRPPDARDVLSVATMFYPPNADGVHWFATGAFPAVRRRLPGVRFYVAGSRPPRRIRRLAREPGVVVTGYVADLGPLLRRSAVTVVPVHSGSGMRVKILEAFARGLPVVSTTIGAEGIDARDGEHLLLADDPQAFAARVVDVLTDPAAAAALASAGRALVETRYDWRTALAGLDGVYASSPPSAAGGAAGAPAGAPLVVPIAPRRSVEERLAVPAASEVR